MVNSKNVKFYLSVDSFTGKLPLVSNITTPYAISIRTSKTHIYKLTFKCYKTFFKLYFTTEDTNWNLTTKASSKFVY